MTRVTVLNEQRTDLPVKIDARIRGTEHRQDLGPEQRHEQRGHPQRADLKNTGTEEVGFESHHQIGLQGILQKSKIELDSRPFLFLTLD